MSEPTMEDEPMVEEALLAEEERRGNVYKLLSECYHRPDEGLAELLEEAGGLDGLEVHARELAETIPADLESLRVDYAKLFVGPFELLAPPYGSIYLEEEERVMTASTRDVENRYRQEGLDVDLDEPPDHVAAELEFMYVLVAGEVEAISSSDPETAVQYLRRQRDFLRIHLGEWIDEFAANVGENAEAEFYRRLARQTAAFVEEDVDRLSNRLDAEDGESSRDVLDRYLSAD